MATESTTTLIEPEPGSAGAPAGTAETAAAARESSMEGGSSGIPGSASGRQAMPLDLPDFAASGGSAAPTHGIDLLNDVQLRVTVELGRSRMNVEDVLRLGEGSIVELDKLAGDPVDVLVNERLVARGEVLVLNDTFSVRVNEIVTPGNQED